MKYTVWYRIDETDEWHIFDHAPGLAAARRLRDKVIEENGVEAVVERFGTHPE
jgi:hypothetical protein